VQVGKASSGSWQPYFWPELLPGLQRTGQRRLALGDPGFEREREAWRGCWMEFRPTLTVLVTTSGSHKASWNIRTMPSQFLSVLHFF
jgi:hypothetical protein